MRKDILEFLNKEKSYLDYIRNNPRWYKRLYYNPKSLEQFKKEASKELKLDPYSKAVKFTNNVSFITSLYDYVKNG